MSIVSTLNRRSDAPFAGTNAPVVCGDYLTDGSRLLYTAGVIGGADGLVWLEDCRSLELLLATASELRRLRPVPADHSSGETPHRPRAIKLRLSMRSPRTTVRT